MNSSIVSRQLSYKSLLPQQIYKEVETIQYILRYNPPFFNKLIKECMKVGKEQFVFRSDINKLLSIEYPELTTYTDGYQLIHITYDLIKQLCVYEGDARDQLEHAIGKVFLFRDIINNNDELEKREQN